MKIKTIGQQEKIIMEISAWALIIAAAGLSVGSLLIDLMHIHIH